MLSSPEQSKHVMKSIQRGKKPKSNRNSPNRRRLEQRRETPLPAISRLFIKPSHPSLGTPFFLVSPVVACLPILNWLLASDQSLDTSIWSPLSRLLLRVFVCLRIRRPSFLGLQRRQLRSRA